MRIVAALFALAGLAPSLEACTGFWVQRELADQIESARTPEDHHRIAHSLLERADGYASDARRHRSLASSYEASGWWSQHRHHDSTSLRIADHCRSVAASLDRAAAELREMAREHEQIAEELSAHGDD